MLIFFIQTVEKCAMGAMDTVLLSTKALHNTNNTCILVRNEK